MTDSSELLVEATYLAFPFRVRTTPSSHALQPTPAGDDRLVQGPVTSNRAEHVRDQIEQVLFTDPRERVFRPHFGAGVRQLVFEPNDTSLWKMAQGRMIASLGEALVGEVDPKTLEIELTGTNETLELTVSYKLATIDRTVSHRFAMDQAGSGG